MREEKLQEMTQNIKKILVTGSTGFIGLNIIEYYLSRGHSVVSIANTAIPEEVSSIFNGYEGELRHDIMDVEDYGQIKNTIVETKPDGIVIGAAITPVDGLSIGLFQKTLKVNVIGALNALEAANHAKVSNIIFLSSASVYGTAKPLNDRLSEDSSLPTPQTIYGQSKLTAETHLQQYAKLHSLSLSILRIGTVFGPWERETGMRDTMSPVFQTVAKIRTGEQILLPENSRRDYVYSRDVANTIAAVLAAKPENRILNLGFGEEWGLEQWCVAASAYADFQWSVASSGANNVEFHGGTRYPLCASKLLNFLGEYRPYTIEEAAKDYFSWLQKTGTK